MNTVVLRFGTLQKQADVNTGLLLLGALCHILLLMFGYAMNSGEHAAVDAVRRLALSRACSVVMLLAYVAYLFFQLKTHRQLFESKEVRHQALCIIASSLSHSMTSSDEESRETRTTTMGYPKTSPSLDSLARWLGWWG